ncbi:MULTISPECIES: CotH kinase family protein [Paenibacillus]|uniref:CotH kinase family protein n=1 Tax=Paenibacillus TaxID=44249 RepID=UPI000BA19081|nr:CotH kinase family protein [Paenibacillus odorifer]OZQ71279.1 hypothetical protein CA596_22615 [Paenibacillus odorifer]
MVKKKNLLRKFMAVTLSLAIVSTAFGVAGNTPVVSAADAGVTKAYESLFAGDRIIDVKVTIDDADWKSILASPLEKEYKKVKVEVDGNVVENVGFSTKGNLTLKSVASMTDSDRYSFRLKFDKYDKKQTLLGLDKMVLNNNFSDPSYIREYLHYEALRSVGVDAPLTVFTNLYINGELYGFYVGVEAIDDSYLERTYGENYDDGVLYDTEEKSYLQYKEGSDYETITYDTGKEDDKASLKNFIKVLNEMPAGEKGSIESVLDVDSALKYIAANAVLGNYDSYNGDKGHNYMLYGDASGKFSVLPWDMNMSFNGYSGGGGGRIGTTDTTAAAGTTSTSATTIAANTNAVTASIDNPTLGISLDQVPMIANLLEVPEYKTKYLKYVSELVDYLEGIQSRITELATLIKPYVQADPTKFYTMEQFESNVTYSATGEMGGSGGMTPPAGMEGMTPPEGMEGMTPPDGTTPPARPDNTGTATDGNPTPPTGNAGGGGQGMGTMAAGSIMTFALNRLANLQGQLGLNVTPLPSVNTTPSTTNPNTTGTNGISVLLNGTAVSFADQLPVNKDGRVLVPVNAIFNALGATVTMDQTTKKITAVKDNTTIVMAIGSKTAYINGKALTLDVPPQIIGNRTLVPVRFISEGLNMDVKWDAGTSTVTATTKTAA